jgi:hypothetical protein
VTAEQWSKLKADPDRCAAHREKATAATKRYRATPAGRESARRACRSYHRRLREAYKAQKETATP